jgi:hypothetical protein
MQAIAQPVALAKLLGMLTSWARSRRDRTGAAAVLALFLGSASAQEEAVPHSGQPLMSLDVRSFRPVDGPSSGPEVYYSVISADSDGTFLRGGYHPGLETVTMGIEVPEQARRSARRLRWRWRARAFPAQGNECRPGRGDSAASVVAAFKRGLKWYLLKYAWSSVGPLGAVCDQKRTLLLARDTIILESGGVVGVWLTEVVDLRRAFVNHFAKGNPHADIPDLVGVAVMTDGDQTNSESGADWSGFEIVY